MSRASMWFCGAPETIRTSDTRFRKPVLYPLSYEGGWCCREPPLSGAVGIVARSG